MKNNKLSKILGLMVPALLFACSTTHPRPSPITANGSSEAQAATVEISYTLAQNLYQLHFDGSPRAMATESLNHKQTHSAKIDQVAFQKFVQSVRLFAAAPQRVPAQSGICRTPYALTLHLEGKTQTVTGCRSEDEGAFSKLIRDGEHFFLVHQK